MHLNLEKLQCFFYNPGHSSSTAHMKREMRITWRNDTLGRWGLAICLLLPKTTVALLSFPGDSCRKESSMLYMGGNDGKKGVCGFAPVEP
jgi:hypothetical protein